MSRPTHSARLRNKGLSPSGVAPKGQGAVTRQCVVCRRKMGREALIQLMASAGKTKMTLRRQYACIRAACLKSALHQISGEAVVLSELARLRLVGLLGLARRQGELTSGAQAILNKPVAPQDVFFVASDCASRTRHQLTAAVSENGLHDLFDQNQLARATGTTSAVALSIRSGRIAMQAVYWLRVWYEAQLLESRSPTHDVEAANESTRVDAHKLQRLSHEASTD